MHKQTDKDPDGLNYGEKFINSAIQCKFQFNFELEPT